MLMRDQDQPCYRLTWRSLTSLLEGLGSKPPAGDDSPPKTKSAPREIGFGLPRGKASGRLQTCPTEIPDASYRHRRRRRLRPDAGLPSGTTPAHRRGRGPRTTAAPRSRKVATLCRDGFRVEAGPNGFLDTQSPPTSTSAVNSASATASPPPATPPAATASLLLNGRLRRAARRGLRVVSWPAAGYRGWRGKLDLCGRAAFRAAACRDDAFDESIDAFARRRGRPRNRRVPWPTPS